MEMDRRQRQRVAPRDIDAHDDADDASGVGEVPMILHDDGLRQWKRERLAYHHAYFMHLDKAFSRWKCVTLARRQRRQRVIAACRVGAKFFQRLYWNQWIETIARRRAAREAAIWKLQTVVMEIRRRTVWVKWREATVRKALARPERMAEERRLEVRGAQVQKKAPLASSSRRRTEISEQLRIDRGRALKKINVYFSQRHHFQLWRDAARAVSKAIAQELRDKADRFRIGSAWQRWRRGFTSRSEYNTASRQAVCFLYYHLTKASITKLRRFADRERQERGIVVVIADRVRRRRLSSALTTWRQRLDTKLVFAEWRTVVMTGSSRASNPQLRVVRNIVRGLETSRLLHRSFSVWLEQSTHRRRHRALAHFMGGTVSKATLARAFRLWKRHASVGKDIEDKMAALDRKRLRNVWQSWARFAKEKQVRERQRRTATRVWYYRTLRRSFTAMQSLRHRRVEIDATVENKIQAATVRLKRDAFGCWSLWCKTRQWRRGTGVLAQQLHAQATMRSIFRVFAGIREEAQQRKLIATRHAHAAARKQLRRIIEQWRMYHNREKERTGELERRLTQHLLSRATAMKRFAFDVLEDHSKSKQSRRLISARARGHFQSSLLCRAFSKWVSFVAQIKWEHILTQRAKCFRNEKLTARCFYKWKRNMLAIRQYRKKTRLALHHWKRVREREVFEGWKRHIADKRRHRERMHEALEFRHHAHIREGLSQWIEGAAQLAYERSRRTVETQATHTENVWNMVREIAAHWRYITHKNKHGRTTDQQPREPERNEVILRMDLNEANAVNDLERFRDDHRRVRRRPASNVLRYHADNSVLSEFVILPRNRPRPRKPIELVLDSEVPATGSDDIAENGDMYGAIENVNRQYGFQFPLSAAPITEVAKYPYPPSQATQMRSDNVDSSEYRDPPTSFIPKPQETDFTIDELEQRLAQWQKRHQQLKQLQHSLQHFKQLLDQASMQGNLHHHELETMRSRLQAMEQREADSRRRWNASRPEIISLAQHIKLLRGVSTISP